MARIFEQQKYDERSRSARRLLFRFGGDDKHKRSVSHRGGKWVHPTNRLWERNKSSLKEVKYRANTFRCFLRATEEMINFQWIFTGIGCIDSAPCTGCTATISQGWPRFGELFLFPGKEDRRHSRCPCKHSIWRSKCAYRDTRTRMPPQAEKGFYGTQNQKHSRRYPAEQRRV